jgi:hypothetical protein
MGVRYTFSDNIKPSIGHNVPLLIPVPPTRRQECAMRFIHQL